MLTSRFRSALTGVLLLVYACLATAIWPARVLAQSMDYPQLADFVLTHGKIITVDGNDTIVEAVAVKEGKILFVGSSAAADRYAGPHTEVLDLHGRTATPGLIDTHLHLTQVDELNEIDLTQSHRLEDVLDLVRQRVAALQPGQWVRGGGWDESKLVQKRYIRASDLDRVAPNNPVWLTQTTGHYGVANTYALRLAGISGKSSKPPPAGTIDRDARGQPTGVLKESAMDLIWRLVPPYTHEQEKQGLLKAVTDANREGMTGVKDPGIDGSKWNLYRELLAENHLSLHVAVLWFAGHVLPDARRILKQMAPLPKPPSGLGDDVLLSIGVKLYMDGSGGGRTGWLYQEWNKNSREVDEGNVGYPTTDPAVYRQMVKLFHDAGYSVGTHAVGDRAIDYVVDTYADVLKQKPVKGLRHSIIHANIPSDHAIAQMAILQKQYDAAYPESQATFMWWIGDTYAGNYGPLRSLRLNPFKTYLRQGVTWTGGSDYPVTPFAARVGIWASIARRPTEGIYGAQPFGSAESVDVHAALRSYTSWAARQLFLENRIGSIEVGKDADIAVWDRDLYTIPTEQIKDMKCELTMFRGRIVYRAAGGPITESAH